MKRSDRLLLLLGSAHSVVLEIITSVGTVTVRLVKDQSNETTICFVQKINRKISIDSDLVGVDYLEDNRPLNDRLTREVTELLKNSGICNTGRVH